MTETASSLAPVTAAAVTGRTADLERSVEACLEAGTKPGALREALLMVALFAGYPRTLDTLGVAIPVLRSHGQHVPEPEASLPGDEGERRALFRRRGRELFGTVYGDADERVLASLLELDPELPVWILEDAYGRVLARPGLTAGDREVLAVVMLCALRLERQLVGHVRGALRCGASADDLRDALAAAGDLLPADLVTVVEEELG